MEDEINEEWLFYGITIPVKQDEKVLGISLVPISHSYHISTLKHWLGKKNIQN